MIDATNMTSGELPSLEYFLERIGGSDEYKGAVLVAALIRTFRSSITSLVFTYGAYAFDIHMVVGSKNLVLDVTFGNAYLYLFKEDE